MPSDVSSSSNSSMINNDERERQIKQAEMIRQYLLVNSVETNPKLISQVEPTNSEKIFEENSSMQSETNKFPFDFPEIRRELKLAEDRVERLREELKDLQKKREEEIVRSPPPYVLRSAPRSPFQDVLQVQQQQRTNEGINSPLTTVQDLRELYSSSQMNSTLNSIGRLTPTNKEISKDQRLLQFILTMNQHREQLLIYLDSLKQVLNTLDRLALMEPTRTEVQLNNIKYEKIQEKSRQIQALKTTRSSTRSPFIENRIRQLEVDLVKLIDEHQKDVRIKLELNGQRTSMLLKIMQINEDLAMVDQQIQQILPSPTSNLGDSRRSNMSSPSSDFNGSSLSEIIHGSNVHFHPDGRRIPFRELPEVHPLTKFTNAFYRHAI